MREGAFFFYGTLMDHDLLSAVLRRRVWPRALAPAVLRGYRRSSAQGASYPVVLRRRGASVAGVILCGVSTAETARLFAYEGDGYELACAVAELPGWRHKPHMRVVGVKRALHCLTKSCSRGLIALRASPLVLFTQINCSPM